MSADHTDDPADHTGTPDRVDRIRAEWARERPDIDTSPMAVIGRLHRAANVLTGEITAVYRRHGLSEGEFDVLAALRRAGAPYQRAAGALADHTMVTSGAMTKRIDRLLAVGLVTRTRDDADGRGRTIGLTDAGLTLIDAVFTEHMANEHRLLAMLPGDDAEALRQGLTAWLARLDPSG